jgi:hypothetical protein
MYTRPHKILNATVIRAVLLCVNKIIDHRSNAVSILLDIFVLFYCASLIARKHPLELLHQVVVHPLLQIIFGRAKFFDEAFLGA